jgi:uncharacterized protein YjbJ (UPF0337 family)
MTGQHRAKEVKGRIKEAAGVLSGNEKLERDGAADQTSARIERVVDEAADALRGAADTVVRRDG